MAMTSSSSNSARLPITIRPKHYDIQYHRIDLVKHNFEGTVSLTGVAVQNGTLRSICVHALELQLIRATFMISSDNNVDDTTKNPIASTMSSTIEAIEYRYNQKNQTCEICFDGQYELLEGKEYVLKMDFMGILNDQMRGFYRSTYIGMDGVSIKTMATTQFEPTDARRAFPCLDEPALKATFQVTVTIPSNLQCISNTPMSATHTKFDTNHQSTMKTVTFQKTPFMSTYLVAFIIGEFDGISCTSRNIVTTVYTVPGKASGATFCLDVATRCLDLYQDLYGINYPLTKSDLIAVPDFAAGAMENWGCVTYREAKVLVKPNLTSETTKRGIARTVCHELAHQWFGNLVTMEWWTQLYLNEGMARFMEFVAIDKLFPEWDAWTEFVQSVYGMAMSLDSMQSSHPVEVEVHHPDEIDSIFDAISYAKGASIIRMIATYIGMDVFFEGMRTYLTRHSYSNTITKDLWIALQEVSNKPVVDFMAPWTEHMGYPILTLSDDNCAIKMDRFRADGPREKDEPCIAWPIPITAKVEGSEEVHGPWIINDPSGGGQATELQTKLKEWSDSSKWFKLNIDQTAFFRVNYTQQQWKRLACCVGPGSTLSASDQVGLISDCFASGKAGYTSITNALTLVENFGQHETADYAVWEELSENLSFLASLYRSEKFFGEFQSFLSRIYSRQMEILGWDPKVNETARTGTLRATVISMMGKSGDDAVALKAYNLFKSSLDDPDGSPVSGDLRESVYRCALRYDEEFVFNALKSKYEQTSFPEEQRDCLAIMGCVKDPKRHADMLDYVFISGKVRFQDFSIPLSSLASTTDNGGRAMWEYFKLNFEMLRSRFVSGPMWPVCVGICCYGMTSSSGADEVEAFFKNPRSPGSAAHRLSQALEVIRTKASSRERDRNAVAAFFQFKVW